MYYALRKLAFINRAVNAPVSEKCRYPRSASEAKCGLNKTGYTEPVRVPKIRYRVQLLAA